MSPSLILASASPRRKALMRQAGFHFRIHASHVPERAPSGLSPSARVEYLALKKAKAVAREFPSDLILAADTLVFINGHAVGKPRNAKHAKRILKELSGCWQDVRTGVSVAWDGGRKSLTGSALSRVKLRGLSNEQIDRASTQHLDKAGAYAVQSKDDKFVDQIRGDYDNVVGLPMKLVKKLLNRLPHSLLEGLRYHINLQR